MRFGLLRVHSRVFKPRLRHLERGPFLRDHRFDVARVDLKQNLTLLHELVVVHVHRRNFPGDLGSDADDVGVDERIVGAFVGEVVEENGRNITDRADEHDGRTNRHPAATEKGRLFFLERMVLEIEQGVVIDGPRALVTNGFFFQRRHNIGFVNGRCGGRPHRT